MTEYNILINKLINRTISSEERVVLEKWVLENGVNKTIFINLIRSAAKETGQNFDADLTYLKFSETIKLKKKTPNPLYKVLKFAAALAILLTTGFLVKQQFWTDDFDTGIIVDKQEQVVAPEGNQIIIKLADGTTKVLNSEGSDVIKDGNGKIIASQGGNTLVFNSPEQLTETEAIINEVYIPFGHTFKLTLSDGTLVWLNAGSRLRFPQKFIESDKERMVYLEGEAYFEVAENKEVPFIVNAHEVDIKVLGTKFNISSYDSDYSIATTLIEGSVSVYETRIPENALLLTPSFQANYNKFENDFSKKKVDTKVFTAWMENKFVIDNLTFSEILVKLERRHNVKFVNNTKDLSDEIYKGEFKNEGIASILETISLSTPFKYVIEQNTITITN